ncbi:unannotated protein [freshwater metagenome]|uniref:Unannotated protein n=1 Tax=freshwater metagenome TaxID=449393 RepID=A0A6J7PML7_9ZZZZ
MVEGLRGASGRVRWMFTDRSGGVSTGAHASLNLADRVDDDPGAVSDNRARVAVSMGVAPDRLVVMEACHGIVVSVVESGVDPLVSGVDALVTRESGRALAALAADCLPIVLHDSGSGIVGVVHSGWVGVRDDVVGAALDAMAVLGAVSVSAVIGPAVCGRCYAVPIERVAEVADRFPEAASVTLDGRAALNLPAAVAARLVRAGVEVADVGVCTVESSVHFSYRRDHVTGRQAAIVVLEAP